MKISHTTLYLMGLCAFTSVMAAAEEVTELDAIEVISSTPLKGGDVDKNKIPTSVQKVSAEALKKSQAISPADYMNQYLGSVSINEAQSNPLQPDIYYRGFVASPLMGMPQGLSMYVNGVRYNEPFGDSVNWDLLPPGAIQSMELHGGSNPVYGLNTLGGAISLRTKTGFDFKKPQHQFEVSGGSWGRHSEELTSGGNNGTFGYFLDLRNFNEDGWRDHSGTAAKQLLGSLSWRTDKASVDVTVATNDNRMTGNGAVPLQLLEESNTAIFTHPDRTITRSFFSEIEGSYAFTDKIKLSANAYFRQNKMRSFNGDVSNYDNCTDPLTGIDYMCQNINPITGLGESIADANGVPILADPALEGAVNNHSQTNMRSRGATLQSVFSEAIFGHKNNLIVGAAYDIADSHYAADTELASLTASRGTIGGNVLTQIDRVRLNTSSNTYSAYFSDTFSVTDALTMTLAGRFNHTTLELNDQYIFGDSLSGKHSFERFNPSAGFTYQLHPAITFFGNYSESSRAPTAMELSCANKDAPCKLPNAFLSDPPLAQVVTKTWETGVRGALHPLHPKLEGQWNLGYFRSTSFDDIIFQHDGNSVGAGYFKNVGQTQRHGIEAGLNVNYEALFRGIDDWHFSTHYTYLNARFRNTFITPNPLDNTVGADVRLGSRIPGLPEHIFKASLGVELWKRASLTLDGSYSGARYLRGDEANITQQLAGYWLFNLKGEIKIIPQVTLFGQVSNLFNHRYNSFGMYGNDLNDVTTSFVSPGAPRAGWVGVRFSL